MKHLVLSATMLIFLLSPAMGAPDFNPTQYSGPGAQIENRGMENAGSPNLTRSAPRGSIGPNDTGYDATIERRQLRLQDTLTRQREEARQADEYYKMRHYHVNE